MDIPELIDMELSEMVIHQKNPSFVVAPHGKTSNFTYIPLVFGGRDLELQKLMLARIVCGGADRNVNKSRGIRHR